MYVCISLIPLQSFVGTSCLRSANFVFDPKLHPKCTVINVHLWRCVNNELKSSIFRSSGGTFCAIEVKLRRENASFVARLLFPPYIRFLPIMYLFISPPRRLRTNLNVFIATLVAMGTIFYIIIPIYFIKRIETLNNCKCSSLLKALNLFSLYPFYK